MVQDTAILTIVDR